ncbi:MAG: hypothetical protein QN163_10870 [Armatimonadota bacterium]|nr:hypothetical protein [Armatimonadota bacterium]
MPAATIFTSTIANDLQDTLEEIIVDRTDGLEARLDMPKFMDVRRTKSAFVDMLEVGGLGVAVSVGEGEEIPARGISEGALTRLWVRKFGLRTMATEEALADGKTDKVINAARRLKRAIWKAVDIDAAQVLNRATNTDFPGGDGQPLASAAHTLPGGGTYSNMVATPTAPSEAAYVLARAQADVQVDLDGVIDGVEIEGVAFPIGQRGAWEVLSFSDRSPQAGQYNAVNLINRDKIKLVPVRHWTASEVDYCWLTDHPDEKLCWYWRERPSSRTWVSEARDVMNYSVKARWARGWSGGRGILYNQG